MEVMYPTTLFEATIDYAWTDNELSLAVAVIHIRW